MKALYWAIVCLVAISTTACASDINFGSIARSSGMGGAGLALGDDSGTTAVVNPASAAVSGRGVRFVFPGISFRTDGATFKDLSDSIDKISSGDNNDAVDLLSDFGTHRTSLGFSTVTGFAGPLGITAEAEAQGIIIPGDETQQWAGIVQTFSADSLSTFQPQDYYALLDNTDLTNAVTNWHLVPGDSTAPNTLDNTAAEAAFGQYLTSLSANTVQANLAYALPAVSLSTGVNTKKGKLWLGTSMKFLHTEAHTWAVGASADAYNYDGSGRLASVDMGFNAVEQPVQKGTTVKADVGAIYRPEKSLLQYGVVVNNFIKPKMKGFADPQSDRMISLGVAAVPNRNLVLAADLINITGANGDKAQLRMGGEMRLGRLLVARAGYSGSKWTYGVGLLGINLSWAGESAQLLSNVLKF